MYDDYIAHHGVPNQKWGVRHGPPYPVVRGSGGKPKTTSIVKSKLKATTQAVANARTQRKAAAAEARQRAQKKRIQQREDQKAANRERLREQIVRHPKELYKHKNEFSRKEIEDIIKDIEFDRKIKDVRDSEFKRGVERFKAIREGVNTAYNFANDVRNAYNIAVEVHNAFDTTGNQWKKFGESNSNDIGRQFQSQSGKSNSQPQRKPETKKPEQKQVDYSKELSGYKKQALNVNIPKSGSILDVSFDDLFKDT